MTSRYVVETLAGRHVRLEPLAFSHVEPLLLAATEDSPTFDYTVVPQEYDTMYDHVLAQLRDFDAGLVVPFVQVDLRTGRVVGMTRYLTIRSRSGVEYPYAVEIGGTWLAPSAQRSGVNTDAKCLLLTHAFERWHVTRVDIKTDDRNERAKAAIARLGATFEGVLRHWQPSLVVGEESAFRNTAMFSIIDEEWPQVSARLAALIEPRTGRP